MFNLFKKGKKDPENIQELLQQFRELRSLIEKLQNKLVEIEAKSESSIQKMSIVRYNPFSDVGGNQSFSIALLNGNNSGIVITSLYTKEGSRIYSKPIKNGVSEYVLSEEEKEVINKAINNARETKFNSEGEKNSNGASSKTASSGGNGAH